MWFYSVNTQFTLTKEQLTLTKERLMHTKSLQNFLLISLVNTQLNLTNCWLICMTYLW